MCVLFKHDTCCVYVVLQQRQSRATVKAPCMCCAKWKTPRCVSDNCYLSDWHTEAQYVPKWTADLS